MVSPERTATAEDLLIRSGGPFAPGRFLGPHKYLPRSDQQVLAATWIAGGSAPPSAPLQASTRQSQIKGDGPPTRTPSRILKPREATRSQSLDQRNGQSPRFCLSQPATVGSLPTGGGAVGRRKSTRARRWHSGHAPHALIERSWPHGSRYRCYGSTSGSGRGSCIQERLTPPFVSLSCATVPGPSRLPLRAAAAGLDRPACPLRADLRTQFAGAVTARTRPHLALPTVPDPSIGALLLWNQMLSRPPTGFDRSRRRRGRCRTLILERFNLKQGCGAICRVTNAGRKLPSTIAEGDRHDVQILRVSILSSRHC